MGGPKPHVLLVGGDGRPSGVPRHIVHLARVLQPIARVSVMSERDQGGYAELDARHIPISGLASQFSPRAMQQGYAELVAVVAKEDPDIVWLHARAPVILGRLAFARGAYHTRLAVTFHGLPFGPGHLRPLSALSRRVETYMAKHVPHHQMVFLTKHQQIEMETHLGSLAMRHGRQVLSNASHLGTLPPPVRRTAGRRLVMTARAGRQKNLEVAAALLRYLPEDIGLTLCGPGTDAPRFAARLRAIAGGAAANRLSFLGPISDVRPLLASADGYLLTSRYEGEPIGALEAWEAGLPVFLTPFSGARALARHPFSMVLNSSSPQDRATEIAAGLAEYLANRNANQTAIRRSWQVHHAPEKFAARARALVESWL